MGKWHCEAGTLKSWGGGGEWDYSLRSAAEGGPTKTEIRLQLPGLRLGKKRTVSDVTLRHLGGPRVSGLFLQSSKGRASEGLWRKFGGCRP